MIIISTSSRREEGMVMVVETVTLATCWNSIRTLTDVVAFRSCHYVIVLLAQSHRALTPRLTNRRLAKKIPKIGIKYTFAA